MFAFENLVSLQSTEVAEVEQGAFRRASLKIYSLIFTGSPSAIDVKLLICRRIKNKQKCQSVGKKKRVQAQIQFQKEIKNILIISNQTLLAWLIRCTGAVDQ